MAQTSLQLFAFLPFKQVVNAARQVRCANHDKGVLPVLRKRQSTTPSDPLHY